MKYLKNILDIVLPWRIVGMKDQKKGFDGAKDEPFIKLSLQTYKVRRNMLLCGVLCAAQGYGAVSGNPTIVGMNINLPLPILNTCLLLISLYFGAYFMTLAWETGDKWRLRRTGVPDSFLEGTQPALDGPSASNVFQSTAWEIIKNETATFYGHLKILKTKIDDFDQTKERELTNSLKDLPQAVDQRIANIKNPLEKFEASFWDSQSKRWIVFLFFEFHGPIFLCFFCWFWLLGRIVFDVFLRCPAVQ